MSGSVGQVQSQAYMADTRIGHGFVILDHRGRPVCGITFRTREEADQARQAISKWVSEAVEIARAG